MKSHSFLKHAAVYGLASMLTQIAGFVLLPMYTRYLSRSEYGILEIVGRVAETAPTLLLFGGLRQALLTFYQQAPSEAQRRRVISAAFVLAGGACLSGLAVSALLVRPLHRLILAEVGDGRLLLTLALCGILCEPFTMLPLALLQSRMESTRFVLTTFTQFVTLVAVRVVFVAWFGWGVAGVLAGTLVTTACYGAFLTYAALRSGLVLPRWETIRGLLHFALPFLPGSVCFFVLQHGDRFFLKKFAGMDEVGTYSLGYKLALAVGTFSLTPLYMVWSAHMYDAADQPDAPAVFGRVFTRVLGAFVFVGLGLCLYQDEIVRFIAGAHFAPAALVIAPVVLAGYFQTASALMDAAFYIRRRTSRKLRLTLEATAVMLVLYLTLIPTLKSLGAALATLGGFAFLAVRTWQTTQRLFPVRYEWRRVAACLTLAVGLWALSRLLPLGAGAFTIRGLLLGCWPLLVWHLGLLDREEKEYAFTTLRRLWLLVRRRSQEGVVAGESVAGALDALPVTSQRAA